MATEVYSLIPDPSEEDAEAIEVLETSIDTSDGPKYLPGLKFDEDLYLNGSGNILRCNEAEAWLVWCKKILATPRYVCDEYSNQIGIDTDSAFKAKTRAGAEEILKAEIRGALKADPYRRTANVESIRFNWFAPDAVEVSTLVTGFDNIKANITTTLRPSGLGE